MLNESELEIVLNSRIHAFGAYLQGCWFHHGSIAARLKKGNFPTHEEIEEIYDEMQRFKLEFDILYLQELPEAHHPLREEQEAWKRLSPDVGKFLKGLQNYSKSYSSENVNEEEGPRLRMYINIWWAFLQEWNTISKLYIPKIEQVYSHLASQGITTISIRKPQLRN